MNVLPHEWVRGERVQLKQREEHNRSLQVGNKRVTENISLNCIISVPSVSRAYIIDTIKLKKKKK